MVSTAVHRLALLGGPKVVQSDPGDMVRWPIVTPEMEAAVLDVLRAGAMSDTDVTREFEKEYAAWHGVTYALAHGGLYKGRLVGTIGDVAAASLMSGKSFAIGEGGMLLTNDRRIYERAVAFAHYERHAELTFDDLVAGAHLPWGGYKYRMHQ